MTKERYFFVSYSFTAAHLSGFGNISFTANGMPKKASITESCEAEVKKHSDLKDKKITIVIIGWNEMTKKDYESFN